MIPVAQRIISDDSFSSGVFKHPFQISLTAKGYFTKLSLLNISHMKNTVVGGVFPLNDIICKPATSHGQGEVIIE